MPVDAKSYGCKQFLINNLILSIMKKLERDEMKNLKGGLEDDDALKCGNGCMVQIPDKCPTTCPCAQQIPGVYKCLTPEP